MAIVSAAVVRVLHPSLNPLRIHRSNLLLLMQVRGLSKRVAVVEEQLRDSVLDDFRVLMGTVDVKVGADTSGPGRGT